MAKAEAKQAGKEQEEVGRLEDQLVEGVGEK